MPRMLRAPWVVKREGAYKPGLLNYTIEGAVGESLSASRHRWRGGTPEAGPGQLPGGHRSPGIPVLAPLHLRVLPRPGHSSRVEAEAAAGPSSGEGAWPCSAMSGGFELQPRDGGPRVALAPGETVIGRGPLLGVSVGGGSANQRAVGRPSWLPRPCFWSWPNSLPR